MAKIELRISIKRGGNYSNKTLRFDNLKSYNDWMNQPTDDSKGKLIGIHQKLKQITKTEARGLWESKVIFVKKTKYGIPQQLNRGIDDQILEELQEGCLLYTEL